METLWTARGGEAPPRRDRTRRLAGRAVLTVVVLLGLEMTWIHSQTGQFRPWPSAIAPYLHLGGRDYHRGGPQVPEPGAVPDGHTVGGGTVWIPDDARTPTVVWVTDGGTSYDYALMGGP